MVPLRSDLAPVEKTTGPCRRVVIGQKRSRLSLPTQAVHPRGVMRGPCLAFAIVGLFFAHSEAVAADALLAAWFNAQTNVQSWSAEVTQTRSLKTLTQPLIARGRVWFAAPNRFRWEIGTPAKTIAVREPAQMLVIYPQLKRAERYPLTGEAMGEWKETLALLEAGFPRTRAELEGRFKILSQAASNDVCELVLQPKSAAARRLIPAIKIAFATNDFSLRATELTFADGSRMSNEFTHSQLNPPLNEDLFSPKLADDFKIVEPLKR